MASIKHWSRAGQIEDPRPPTRHVPFTDVQSLVAISACEQFPGPSGCFRDLEAERRILKSNPQISMARFYCTSISLLETIGHCKLSAWDTVYLLRLLSSTPHDTTAIVEYITQSRALAGLAFAPPSILEEVLRLEWSYFGSVAERCPSDYTLEEFESAARSSQQSNSPLVHLAGSNLPAPLADRLHFSRHAWQLNSELRKSNRNSVSLSEYQDFSVAYMCNMPTSAAIHNLKQFTEIVNRRPGSPTLAIIHTDLGGVMSFVSEHNPRSHFPVADDLGSRASVSSPILDCTSTLSRPFLADLQ